MHPSKSFKNHILVPFFKPYIKSLHNFWFLFSFFLRYCRDFEKFSEFSRPKKKNLKFSLKIQKKKIHSSKLEKFFKIPTQPTFFINSTILIF